MKIPLPTSLKRNSFRTSITALIWRIRPLPGIVALAISLMGCGSTKPIKYYQVNYPTKSFVAQDAINTSLLVHSMESSHLYLNDKIVYGYDSPEMGTYEYQRWAEPPVEILQNSLARGLRASGRFRAVYTLHTDADSRFILGGHLYDFKEIDGTSTVARLTFAVRLRDRKAGTTVWEHSYMHDEPASEKTVNAFVLAMGKNLQQGVQEVQAGLDEYFRAHPIQ